MRLIVMGTGPFAVPSLNTLAQSSHELLGVVTRPTPPRRRKSRAAITNPARDLAESLGLAVLTPASVNDAAFVAQLAAYRADLFFVCDYGQILSADCLAAARLGGINLHGSLLPKYRGAAPINWAIYHGETETGVTVIHMTPRMDAGPMLVQKSLPIGPRETAAELEPRLAELGAQAVTESLQQLAAWDGNSPLGARQSADEASRAPRLKKTDGRINWQRSAVGIANQVRAFQPWPGSFTTWQSAAGELRLIIHAAEAVLGAGVDAPAGNATPTATPIATPTARRQDLAAGQVAAVGDQSFDIATGDGWLRIEEIQPAGKRVMSSGEFLRGHPLAPGDRFA